MLSVPTLESTAFASFYKIILNLSSCINTITTSISSPLARSCIRLIEVLSIQQLPIFQNRVSSTSLAYFKLAKRVL